MEGNLLSTITFPELTDLIRREWVATQGMITPQARQLYITDPIAKGQGASKIYNEIDTETYAKLKRQGEAVQKASVGVGYNKTMYKKRIGLEIDITQEMRDENRYPEVGALITNLTHFCPQRIELDATHRLTFGTSTSYTDMDGDTVDLTGGDGLAIFSAVHTLKFSTITWSNRVSGDPVFSQGALEAAELLTTTDILSNFGEKRVMTFNTIVTGTDPNTKNTVKQFLNSSSDVNQNNPGVLNVYQNSYTHLVLPQLATTATGANDSTKRRYWFLASLGKGAMGLQAYYGQWEAPHMVASPASGNNMEDPHKDIWSWGTRAGYGFVFVSGRGIIGSFPTS
jgi:hypothetical protein